MTPLFPNVRYERKFFAGALSLAQVLAVVQRHPALFREVFPPRTVNNIYLDSPGLGDYFAHVNGTPNRAKTRIRWYGPADGRIEKPTLERKIKRGLVSGKLAYPLPPLSCRWSHPFREIESAWDSETLPDLLREAMRRLHPSLINCYQRRYFLSADRRFRLTVDWDLRFQSARWGPGGAATIRPREPAVIIELKYGPEQAEQAALVTNALPFRLVRCSKYVLGIEIATDR